MSERLAARECEPCHGGVPPLEGEELDALLDELPSDWEVVDGHHLAKTFEFEDFVSGLDFVNEVGELAEEQGHHPDLHLSWGEVRVEVWTHAIDGLSDNDFVLAAKIEQL